MNPGVLSMRLWLAVILLWLLATNVFAQVTVGSVRPYGTETSHPYPAGSQDRPVVSEQHIAFPGAKFLRLHFVAMSLAPGDYLTVSGADGSEIWSYCGRGPDGDGDFWIFALSGDEVYVRLHGGPAPGYGYRISEVGIGEVDLANLDLPAEKDCPDTRENVACHQDDPKFWSAQKAVARLLFSKATDATKMAVCTGWLVTGADPDTLITNRHCISSQDQIKSLQATFNLQTIKCEGKAIAVPSTYGGEVLLRVGPVQPAIPEFDYSLIQLKGSPQKAWGAIQALSRDPKLNEEISIPQHPEGGLKLVAWWEDPKHTMRCTVTKVYGALGEFGWTCAGSPGSSGSPILDVSGGGLGLVTVTSKVPGECFSVSLQLKAICKDAAAFLKCSD